MGKRVLSIAVFTLIFVLLLAGVLRLLPGVNGYRTTPTTCRQAAHGRLAATPIRSPTSGLTRCPPVRAPPGRMASQCLPTRRCIVAPPCCALPGLGAP
jgi:hypothetical protein